ncbi:MAG: DnaJ domain-containing protein [Phycisphaerales bacterium]|nr:DnaJ domain-containing protein [Phycisphaerales bacterium]
MYYFELFDLTPTFFPSPELLKKKYYELSKTNHPDRFTQANSTEQLHALSLTTDINKAYKTLSDKDELVAYILKEKELLVENEKFELPSDFLMLIMELNEQLNDNQPSPSNNTPINNLLNTIYEPVKEIMENFKENSTTKEELLQIKVYYFKKKYVQRLLTQNSG